MRSQQEQSVVLNAASHPITLINSRRLSLIIIGLPSEIIETYVRDKRTQDYIRALLKDESN